jgi:hypothetical protein
VSLLYEVEVVPDEDVLAVPCEVGFVDDEDAVP